MTATTMTRVEINGAEYFVHANVAHEIAGLRKCVGEVQKENDHLRAAISFSKDPCTYCSLPADEIAKCRAGFPGCARMDDMTGCPEFGAMMQLAAANDKIARLREALTKIAACEKRADGDLVDIARKAVSPTPADGGEHG